MLDFFPLILFSHPRSLSVSVFPSPRDFFFPRAVGPAIPGPPQQLPRRKHLLSPSVPLVLSFSFCLRDSSFVHSPATSRATFAGAEGILGRPRRIDTRQRSWDLSGLLYVTRKSRGPPFNPQDRALIHNETSWGRIKCHRVYFYGLDRGLRINESVYP